MLNLVIRNLLNAPGCGCNGNSSFYKNDEGVTLKKDKLMCETF